MYLFQFPAPFPTFRTPAAPAPTPATDSPRTKRVSFAEGVKGEASEPDISTSAAKPLEGLIGNLEVHTSGAVRIRLGHNMLFDVSRPPTLSVQPLTLLFQVSAATQPSFLQQAVVFDIEQGSMNVLGSVQRRFVVSPDLDMLLDDVAALEAKKAAAETIEDDVMDQS